MQKKITSVQAKVQIIKSTDDIGTGTKKLLRHSTAVQLNSVLPTSAVEQGLKRVMVAHEVLFPYLLCVYPFAMFHLIFLKLY